MNKLKTDYPCDLTFGLCILTIISLFMQFNGIFTKKAECFA